jgi:hypothetical protein
MGGSGEAQVRPPRIGHPIIAGPQGCYLCPAYSRLVGWIILWPVPSAAGHRSLLISSGLQILSIAASGCWYFWDADLSFGMIGGFTSASRGTLGRFWETGEHNTGNFKVQAWIFTDFWWILLVPMGVI